VLKEEYVLMFGGGKYEYVLFKLKRVLSDFRTLRLECDVGIMVEAT